MGKVRRLRKKYHLSTVGQKKEPNFTDWKCLSNANKSVAGVPLFPAKNLFENIKIDIDKLNTSLEDCQEQNPDSVSDNEEHPLTFNKLGEKSTEVTKKLTKKQKLKLRRDTFLAKIEQIKNEKDQQIKLKKREKTVIVKDLKPLQDCLEEIAIPKAAHPVSKVSKTKKRANLKKQKKLLLEDIKSFKSVLNHKEFKKDPLGSIEKHIKENISKL